MLWDLQALASRGLATSVLAFLKCCYHLQTPRVVPSEDERSHRGRGLANSQDYLSDM